MRILFQNQWLKWLSVFVLAVLVLGGAYYYQTMSLGKVQAAYTIANSTRFISGNSDYLSKAALTSTATAATWSFWVKRATLGTNQGLIGANRGSQIPRILFTSSDTLNIIQLTGTSETVYPSMVFRDPAAWTHIVVAVDTTQSTASDRINVYVNGSKVTNFSTAVYPTQNATLAQYYGVEQWIGRVNDGDANRYLDGYLSDVYLIDGQQLTPSSFGESDTNGYWRPKTYSGTYGTNGFHLPLMGTSTAASVGTDTSGNGNTWTVNNIATTDFVKDSPTNSFATLSPVDKGTSVVDSSGNLVFAYTAANTERANFGMSSGKWYWEVTKNGTNMLVGIAKNNATLSGYLGSDANGWGYQQDGNKYNNGTPTAYGATYANADVIGVAFDADAGTLTFYKNNSSQGTAFTGLTSGPYFPAEGDGGGTGGTFDFGQGGQSGLTYDSASGGTFKYTPPSGFKALSTNNLPAPTIAVPKNYFDAVTYTGSGTATSTWSGFVAFQPDLVWIKNRTDVASHALFDAVRGVQKFLSSDSTAAEDTDDTESLSSFDANGFSLGTGASTANVNTSAKNYISWLWKESPTSGVDIVTYTGTGVAKTEAHALSSAPEMIIVKDRTAASTNDWAVYHAANTSAPETDYLLLNSTAATADDATYWNDTAPTASVFSVGTNADVNTNTNSYVAYLFDQVEGFSKFGSYTGNGSADGPFIYTGFKPRYLLVKRTNTTGGWFVWDTARDTYNPAVAELLANTTAAEAGTADLDALSNGFKLRATTAGYNASGGTYIYAAFADIPFYYSAQAAASGVITSAVTFLMGMTF